ncbi:unnamed protein product, partial [Nesidiocoris tenuis]
IRFSTVLKNTNNKRTTTRNNNNTAPSAQGVTRAPADENEMEMTIYLIFAEQAGLLNVIEWFWAAGAPQFQSCQTIRDRVRLENAVSFGELLRAAQPYCKLTVRISLLVSFWESRWPKSLITVLP